MRDTKKGRKLMNIKANKHSKGNKNPKNKEKFNILMVNRRGDNYILAIFLT